MVTLSKGDQQVETQTLIPSAVVRRHFGGISDMTIWRWVHKGILPAPVKINGRNYWREADIAAVQSKGQPDTSSSGGVA